jgi:hypothetical protein
MPPVSSTDDSDWWDVGDDPDAHADLDYELVDLDRSTPTAAAASKCS